MSLKTRFGNLKNVLDEDSSQTEIFTLDSPFVGNAQFDELMTHFNADMVTIDCTFAPGRGNLSAGLARIRAEAEDAVRSGAGHIVLTDQSSGPEAVGMPMILATSAVHSHLVRKGLRTFTSINVRSAECVDPHYFAVLIGAGATTVNAYLAEDSLADRIDRGLLDMSLTTAIDRYRIAIDQGLLKIMAKMGISVISSYRGGPQPRHGCGVFPGHDQSDFRHRHHRHSEEGRRSARQSLGWSCFGASHRRLLQGAQIG